MCLESERDAVIVAYGRAPIAKAGKKGLLRTVHPVDYGAQVLCGVLDRVPTLNRSSIDDVIVGCAKPEREQGMNMGRLLAQRARLPDSVPGKTVNRFCASGLEAVAIAANEILTGQSEVVVAGGVESMTCIPMGGDPQTRNKWLEENGAVYMPMGLTAEQVAARWNVSREEMDAFSAESHRKAAAARAAGQFRREIIPIQVEESENGPFLFSQDQGIRPDTTAETLAGLKPSFREDGRVTAGNASQVSDGAAFVVMMSLEKAHSLGLRPLARFRGYAVAGVPADIMGVGPMYAIPKLMGRIHLSPEDMDVIELNEAFAAQAIPCIRELKLPEDKVNPRGGAIALGHPLGATGAILTCKALSFLEDTGGKYALISMCIGGGMGAAGVLERMI